MFKKQVLVLSSIDYRGAEDSASFTENGIVEREHTDFHLGVHALGKDMHEMGNKIIDMADYTITMEYYYYMVMG